MALDPIARLIQAFHKLPGIGEKSAVRLAFHILREGPSFAGELADALVDATERVHFCGSCMNLTDRPLCALCTDPRREQTSVCVVENVQNLRAIERSQEFRGLYHVLHGVLAPLDGVGPEQLKIKELLGRLQNASSEVREIIVATNPSVEGEATALYLVRLLRPMGYRVTRIASGMPIGGDFEYADPATISQAFAGRRELV
ncbi:MAG: recombination protein RecR [Deltaproteobacteria bacterium]|nr:recombination protein RecR [Deltaproteobacteria bacterium]